MTVRAATRFAVAAALAVAPFPARAQEPSVRLTMHSQSPRWNSPTDTSLTVRFRAENTSSEPIDDLAIGITLWSPVRWRTQYEQSLVADPVDSIPLLAQSRPRTGPMQPGEVRDFSVAIDLPVSQLSSTESLIYPLTIDLRSGYRSLAAIRTPVVYLVRKPLVPLRLSATFVLHAPLSLGADGVFASPSLEQSIAQGGRLAGELHAIRDLAGSNTPVDVAISPMLVVELERMIPGYSVVDDATVRHVDAGTGGSADAAEALSELRAIASAPNVEVSALPYAEPLLPSLTSAGLGRDLGVQLQRGRDVLETALGASPVADLLRPPRSAIDRSSLDEMPAQGISTLVLDPATVPLATDQQGYAPPAIASLGAQNGTVAAVVADPSVEAMLHGELMTSDPALAAQALLGELAAIWVQQPSVERGIALVVGEDVATTGSFFGPFVRGLAGAPWLSMRTALGLVNDAHVPHADGVAELAESSPPGFSASYVGGIRQARRRVEILRSMLVQQTDVPDELDRMLLLAESQRFVGDEPSGLAFVGHVEKQLGSVFGAVRPHVSQVTLTSSSIRGVPIPVENTASVPLRVSIRLVSPHLRAPAEQTRVLPASSTQTLDMDVQLKTTGRFPVEVQVVAPAGKVVGKALLVVRSTAYNRVALVITIAAALLSMLLWARRFLPRRRTA
jgi:hypothetical protein